MSALDFWCQLRSIPGALLASVCEHRDKRVTQQHFVLHPDHERLIRGDVPCLAILPSFGMRRAQLRLRAPSISVAPCSVRGTNGRNSFAKPEWRHAIRGAEALWGKVTSSLPATES